jgi:hypothetical protein
MNPLSEDKDEISGKDFALGIAEHSCNFMKYLDSIQMEIFEKGIKDMTSFGKHIDNFNKEILKLVAKLPIHILGALLHQTAIDKCLDENCVIEISNREVKIFLFAEGTIQ